MSCTALITGGASGLGLAAATGILKKGVCLRVILVDRDEAAVKTAASELQKQFPRSQVEFASGDVTSESDMQKAVDLAASTESLPLRLVLNSAGVGYASRVILKDGTMPTASFSKVLEINLLGTFIVTKLAAEAMTKKSPLISDGFGGETRGAIVNVASIAAFDGQIGQVPYAASKGAVVGMTLPLAREFARHHIRVNTIAPGGIFFSTFSSFFHL